MNKILVYLLFLINGNMFGQYVISQTYNGGILPSNYNSPSPTCPGNNGVIQFELPPLENLNITNVQISYTMTSLAPAWKSDQRSFVQLNSPLGIIAEPSPIAGIGDESGSQVYTRNTTLFNGSYAPNSVLTFSIFPYRTYYAGSECSTSQVFVENNSWTIDITYTVGSPLPKAGVNTTTPNQALQVNGKIGIGNDVVSPTPGAIRYEDGDFEGYDGVRWKSFTKGGSSKNIGVGTQYNNESDVQSIHTDDFSNFYGNNISCNNNWILMSCSSCDSSRVEAYSNGEYIKYKQFLYHPYNNYTSLFGMASALNNSTAFISSPDDEISGIPTGAVYMYNISTSGLSFNAEIVSPELEANSLFGISIAANNNFLAVGAIQKTVGGIINAGKVYIYKKIGSIWQYQRSFSAPTPQLNANFGYKVQMNEGLLVISEPFRDGNRGKVYTSYLLGDTWTELSELTHPTNTNDFFGGDIALHGNNLAVSLSGRQVSGINFAGAVVLFKFSALNFTLQAIISNPKPLFEDYFGSSIVINGDDLFISCPYKKVKGVFGHGQVYQYKIANSVVECVNTIIPMDGEEDLFFGKYMCINYNKLFVSAINKDINSHPDAGKVYIFDK